MILSDRTIREALAGGRIEIESGYGKGTRVSCYLPAKMPVEVKTGAA